MKVEKGKYVELDYEGTLEDGKVFDSSKHGEHSHPLGFVAGEGMVIKGFDDAVDGMEVGDEKTFEIEPEDAYGPYNEELKKDIPRNLLPKDQEPEVGMMMVLATPDGRQYPARIVEVNDKNIMVDLNHPLAGKKLKFSIKVLDIKDEAPKHMCQCNPDSGKECECGDDGCDDDCDCECGEDGCGDDCGCDVIDTKKEEASIEDLAEGK